MAPSAAAPEDGPATPGRWRPAAYGSGAALLLLLCAAALLTGDAGAPGGGGGGAPGVAGRGLAPAQPGDPSARGLPDPEAERVRHCRGYGGLRALAEEVRTAPEGRHLPPDGIGRLLRRITEVRRDAGDVGNFVEIGANDGKIANDSCAELGMRYHWAGVALEPVPAYFRLLRENYKAHGRVHVVNKALANRTGSLRIYTPTHLQGCPWWLSAVSSLDRGLMEKHMAKAHREGAATGCKAAYEEVEIEATTFTQLARDERLGVHVDFLQIDTEGYDLEALRVIDLARFRPLVLKLEYMHIFHRLDEVYALLRANGYYEVRCSPGDLCAFHGGPAVVEYCKGLLA